MSRFSGVLVQITTKRSPPGVKPSCYEPDLSGFGFDGSGLPSAFGSSNFSRHWAASSGLPSRLAGIVKFDEAAEGSGEAGLGGGRDLLFAIFHPGIPFDQERLGFWELLLPIQRAAQYALRAEESRRAGIRRFPFAAAFR